jgi:FMN phosphatase YigB (HAD superfamily)
MIYQLLLAKASHPASECVYIDNKSEYLGPAKNLGMQVITFKNASQLETRLKELLLLPDASYTVSLWLADRSSRILKIDNLQSME